MKQYVCCDLCSSCFESHLKLNVHRRRKHVLETSNPYRDDEKCKPSCQFCKKTCSSLAHLNLHIRRKHELESDDEDSTLNKSDHHKPQMECGDSNSELKFKKNNHKEQGTRCDICGKKFLSISKYNFHFKIKHSRTAKDASCSFSSPSCVKIESHKKEILAATSSRHLALKDQHSNSLQELTDNQSRINPYIPYDYSPDDHKTEKLSKSNTNETKLSKKPASKVEQPERPIPDLICIESDPEIVILKVISPGKTTCKNKNKEKLEDIKKPFVISNSAAEINPSYDLICPKCDQRFEYRAKLNFHYKVKHINVLLMNKEQSDRDSFHTLNGFKTSKTKSQECKISSAAGKKIKPSTYMCWDCCKIFSSVSKLKFHRRVNHVDADDSGLNKHIFSCCICKRTFSTSEELIKHYQEFHKHHLFINNFDCDSSQTNINLTEDKCSFDCCKVKDLGIPMTGCDTSASDAVVKEEITLRNSTAQLQTDSIFGIVKSPPKSENVLYLKNKTKENLFKNSTGISEFNDNYESEIRQLNYSYNKLPDVLKECMQRNTELSEKNQETRKACTAPECFIEENPGSIISVLQQHLQNQTCELCEKYLKTLVSPNDLVKIHYNHQMNAYECEACHRTFRRKHDLSRHSVVHYKRVDGECVCKYCGKQFTVIGNLNRHTKMMHSSFICTICNRNYPKKAVLLEHLNRAHCITCSSAQTMFIRKSLQ